MSDTICFIGAGNMAGALIRGLLASGTDPGSLVACDPSESQRNALADTGIATTSDNAAAITGATVVVLAVKPQIVSAVMKGLTTLSNQHLLVSIVAGVTSRSLKQWSAADQPIVRCMPNTPALVGKSMSALFANVHVSASQRAVAEQLLTAVGACLWVDDESELDAVTALSGSGPAYFFLLMEAMIEAGVKLGLSAKTASQLTLQTAVGAAAMAAYRDAAGEGPATLRNNVTSPGGTTERAINHMLDADLKGTIIAALEGAAQRSEELAREFGN